MDLVDAVQSVCNFLKQRWRNQSSAPDFSMLMFSMKSKIRNPEHHCYLILDSNICQKRNQLQELMIKYPNFFLSDLECCAKHRQIIKKMWKNLLPALVANERWRCWVRHCTVSSLWIVCGKNKSIKSTLSSYVCSCENLTFPSFTTCEPQDHHLSMQNKWINKFTPPTSAGKTVPWQISH